MYACMLCKHIHTPYVYENMLIYICVYIYTYTYAYLCVCTHIHTYTYAHAHTHGSLISKAAAAESEGSYLTMPCQASVNEKLGERKA